MNIMVRRQHEGFRAQLGDDPGKTAAAGSADEAIGALIRKFGSDIGLDVTIEEPPPNKSGLSREHYRNRPQSAADFLRSQGNLEDQK